MQKIKVVIWEILAKGGGMPYNNLWSGAVLCDGASWSLITGKDAGGIRLATGHALRSKRGDGFAR